MTRVNGVGGVAIGGRTKPAAASGSVFDIASGEATQEAGDVHAAQPAGLAGMLALQEAETATVSAKQGCRHGLAVLDALQELQRGLLTGTAGEDDKVARLAQLAGQAPAVMDLKLADILAAIRLRAKIELLRRGAETG